VRDPAYAGKARPAVAVQSDVVSATFESAIMVALTTFDSAAARNRVRLDSTPANGLKEASYVMTEKPFTVRAERLGMRVGVLDEGDLLRVSRSLASVLGITVEDLA
jgi:mRNA interferase MazF